MTHRPEVERARISINGSSPLLCRGRREQGQSTTKHPKPNKHLHHIGTKHQSYQMQGRKSKTESALVDAPRAFFTSATEVKNGSRGRSPHQRDVLRNLSTPNQR